MLAAVHAARTGAIRSLLLANPHLLINQLSALDTGPVSKIYFAKKLRGQPATLERLRVDRGMTSIRTRKVPLAEQR
ncbi:hypothetical protein [Nonomuraea sp. NPDC049695]|uniref:hypothetical protein n=1 Tax=Nonomuraea sp. NPDC049695 TaxID=3154734 RepID=UPI00343D1538